MAKNKKKKTLDDIVEAYRPLLIKITLNLLRLTESQKSQVYAYSISKYIPGKNPKNIYKFFSSYGFKFVLRKGRATGPRKRILIHKNQRPLLEKILMDLQAKQPYLKTF